MAKTKSKVSKIQPQSREQDIVQNTLQSQQQALQQITPSEEKVVQRTERRYPSWPTSKPGPQLTPPLAGMRSVNPFRPEQMAEIDYNQETGQPSIDSPQRSVPDASVHSRFDQPKNAQETLGKRKHRL